MDVKPVQQMSDPRNIAPNPSCPVLFDRGHGDWKLEFRRVLGGSANRAKFGRLKKFGQNGKHESVYVVLTNGI